MSAKEGRAWLDVRKPVDLAANPPRHARPVRYNQQV